MKQLDANVHHMEDKQSLHAMEPILQTIPNVSSFSLFVFVFFCFYHWPILFCYYVSTLQFATDKARGVQDLTGNTADQH